MRRIQPFIESLDDTLKLLGVVPSTPAERAAIRPTNHGPAILSLQESLDLMHGRKTPGASLTESAPVGSLTESAPAGLAEGEEIDPWAAADTEQDEALNDPIFDLYLRVLEDAGLSEDEIDQVIDLTAERPAWIEKAFEEAMEDLLEGSTEPPAVLVEGKRRLKAMINGKVVRLQKSSAAAKRAAKAYYKANKSKIARSRKVRMKKPAVMRQMAKNIQKALRAGTRNEDVAPSLEAASDALAAATSESVDSMKASEIGKSRGKVPAPLKNNLKPIGTMMTYSGPAVKSNTGWELNPGDDVYLVGIEFKAQLFAPHIYGRLPEGVHIAKSPADYARINQLVAGTVNVPEGTKGGITGFDVLYVRHVDEDDGEVKLTGWFTKLKEGVETANAAPLRRMEDFARSATQTLSKNRDAAATGFRTISELCLVLGTKFSEARGAHAAFPKMAEDLAEIGRVAGQLAQSPDALPYAEAKARYVAFVTAATQAAQVWDRHSVGFNSAESLASAGGSADPSLDEAAMYMGTPTQRAAFKAVKEVLWGAHNMAPFGDETDLASEFVPYGRTETAQLVFTFTNLNKDPLKPADVKTAVQPLITAALKRAKAPGTIGAIGAANGKAHSVRVVVDLPSEIGEQTRPDGREPLGN
jgi:hypothetical protein